MRDFSVHIGHAFLIAKKVAIYMMTGIGVNEKLYQRFFTCILWKEELAELLAY